MYLSSLNINMLQNQAVKILHQQSSLVIAGITDPVAPRRGEKGPDLASTLKNVASSDFVILLSHQPRMAIQTAEYPVDLQLSGHTHGGMITGFHLLVSSFNQGFSSGLYPVEQMLLYVSNGTGIWSGFPFRLGKNAEITLLTCSYAKQDIPESVNKE